MKETPLFIAICEEHSELGKSDWLGANHIANEHAGTYNCLKPVHVVHERPWNVAVNTLDADAEDQIKKLGEESRVIYQYGTTY